MNAWPYSRVVPLAGALYNGPMLAWLSHALRVDVTLVGTIFKTDLFLAALTPAALFVHARAGLKDLRAALAALLLMATLPAHIRFSRSDVEFLQSLLHVPPEVARNTHIKATVHKPEAIRRTDQCVTFDIKYRTRLDRHLGITGEVFPPGGDDFRLQLDKDEIHQALPGQQRPTD